MILQSLKDKKQEYPGKILKQKKSKGNQHAYYKATVIKTMWFCCLAGQWKRLECPKMNSNMRGNVANAKGGVQMSWERMDYSINDVK